MNQRLSFQPLVVVLLTATLIGLVPGFGFIFASGPLAAQRAEASPLVVLSQRCCMAFAYFPNPANRIVLYGGVESGSVVQDDTWVYNAVNNKWTQVCDACAPGPRTSTRMVYAPSNGKIMLFGGRASLSPDAPSLANAYWLSYNSQTGQYSWDPCNSTDCPTQPPSRSSQGMAYDALNSQIVMFGGISGTQRQFDTWTWDPANHWQQCPVTICVEGSTAPPRRGSPGMAYQDAVQHKVVLFGGTGAGGQGDDLGDTWFWNGLLTGWSLCGGCTQSLDCTQSVTPCARSGHRMDYNSAVGKIVMFGGFYGDQAQFKLDDTWLWSGTQWQKCNPITQCTAHPLARCCVGLAYFGDGPQKIILFGGGDSEPFEGPNPTVLYNDTWQWDSQTANWTCLRQC